MATKDKYVVSFNSDTSDSESEVDTSEEEPSQSTLPVKKATLNSPATKPKSDILINGTAENGDIEEPEVSVSFSLKPSGAVSVLGEGSSKATADSVLTNGFIEGDANTETSARSRSDNLAINNSSERPEASTQQVVSEKSAGTGNSGDFPRRTVLLNDSGKGSEQVSEEVSFGERKSGVNAANDTSRGEKSSLKHKGSTLSEKLLTDDKPKVETFKDPIEISGLNTQHSSYPGLNTDQKPDFSFTRVVRLGSDSNMGDISNSLDDEERDKYTVDVAVKRRVGGATEKEDETTGQPVSINGDEPGSPRRRTYRKQFYSLDESITNSYDDTGGHDTEIGTVRVKLPGSPNSERASNKERKFSFDEYERKPRRERKPRKKYDWETEDTEDLIKRILAEAREEAHARMEKAALEEADGSSKDTEIPVFGDDNWTSDSIGTKTGSRVSSGFDGDTEKEKSPSLLERRLADMRNKTPEKGDTLTSTDTAGTTAFSSREKDSLSLSALEVGDDDYRQRSNSASRSSWRSSHQTAVCEDDDTYSLDSASALQPASSYAVVPYTEDNDYWRPRRQPVPVLPDEAFKPQRSSETAAIVEERTVEAKSMVKKQDEVLKRLKEASSSFDELDSEIRSIKKQFIESQARRASVVEQLLEEAEESVIRAPPPPPDPYYESQALVPTNQRRLGLYRSATSDYAGSAYGDDYMDDDNRSVYSTRSAYDYEGDGGRYGSSTRYGLRPYSAGSSSYGSRYGDDRGRYGGSGSIYGAYVSPYAIPKEPAKLDKELETDILAGHALSSLARRDPCRRRAASVGFGADVADEDQSYSYRSPYSRSRFRATYDNDFDDSSSVGPERQHPDLDDLDSVSMASGPSAAAGDEEDVPSGYRARMRRAGSAQPDIGSGRSYEPLSDYRSSRYSRNYADPITSNTTSSYRSTRSSYTSRYNQDFETPSTDTYSSRQSRTLGRSQTIGSEYERPKRFSSVPPPDTGSSSGGGFSSRFLDKVREKKASGEDLTSEKRDKPFRSRFLRSSFGRDSYGSGKYGSGTPSFRSSYSSKTRDSDISGVGSGSSRFRSSRFSKDTGASDDSSNTKTKDESTTETKAEE